MLKAEHPLNAAYRQTGTYWEMVYSMVRHGIVHPAFWLENNGEGLFLFVKVEPFLAQLREAGQPTAFRNAEWVARSARTGQPIYERIKARVAQMARPRGAEAPAAPGIAAVVLDFDGLIVDTETPIFEAWLAAYRRRGRSLGARRVAARPRHARGLRPARAPRRAPRRARSTARLSSRR